MLDSGKKSEEMVALRPAKMLKSNPVKAVARDGEDGRGRAPIEISHSITVPMKRPRKRRKYCQCDSSGCDGPPTSSVGSVASSLCSLLWVTVTITALGASWDLSKTLVLALFAVVGSYSHSGSSEITARDDILCHATRSV